MAIRINLDVMLAKRKMSLTELSSKIGISMTNLSLLKTGKVKGVRFTTLDDICIILDCQPGDILEHISEVAQDDSAGKAAESDEEDRS